MQISSNERNSRNPLLTSTDSQIHYRRSSLLDPFRLAKVIRYPDRREIECRHGVAPLPALLAVYYAHRKSDSYTIEWNGTVHGMFGVYRISAKKGSPWFLSSEELVASNRRLFPKESKRWLKALSEGYEVLENHILAENEVHVRWLVAMGFGLLDYIEHYGVARAPFWKFRMKVVQ